MRNHLTGLKADLLRNKLGQSSANYSTGQIQPVFVWPYSHVKWYLYFHCLKKENHNNSKEDYMTDTKCGLQRLKVFTIQFI